jgi:hypothetical protein
MRKYLPRVFFYFNNETTVTNYAPKKIKNLHIKLHCTKNNYQKGRSKTVQDIKLPESGKQC